MKQVLKSFKSFVLSSSQNHPIAKPETFSKFLFVLLLAGNALFISSCQKEELQSSLQKQELQANSQKQEQKIGCVPFKGKFTLSFTQNGPTSTGEGTHIGRFTSVETSSSAVFPEINSTTTSTAANGDQIKTMDIGFATDQGNGLFEVNITCTITGGTGRFAGARGSYKTHAIVNPSAGEGSATFDGTICY
jgi:hypothetical protein